MRYGHFSRYFTRKPDPDKTRHGQKVASLPVHQDIRSPLTTKPNDKFISISTRRHHLRVLSDDAVFSQLNNQFK